MTPDGVDPALWWVIAALLLGLAELLTPGVFLGFLAIAAAVTGALTWTIQPPAAFQFVGFSLLAIAAVLGGRRWYAAHPVKSSDPYINERSNRLVGLELRAVSAFAGGRGRVRMGDTEWLARGPDAAAGALVRVVEVDGATLVVEPVEALGGPAA